MDVCVCFQLMGQFNHFHVHVYPQPHSILPMYDTDVLENSPKMVILVQLLELSVANGDRMLIFRCIELSACEYEREACMLYFELRKWVR